MKIYKYYANGNDFVIFNSGEKKDRSELAKRLCNRYKGIGADGLIVILPHEEYDFEWEFYNCDGSTAAMCGNGARVAAHFAQKIKQKSELSFLTGAGVIKAKILQDLVEISLGKVKYIKEPFLFEGRLWYECDTGVPHLVTFTQNLDELDLKICEILRKKYNANVNYARIVDEKCIQVRTYERGVEAETLACGTGMSACFYLAFLQNLVQKEAKLLPKSQEEVFIRVENEVLYFKGLVHYCFEANYIL